MIPGTDHNSSDRLFRVVGWWCIGGGALPKGQTELCSSLAIVGILIIFKNSIQYYTIFKFFLGGSYKIFEMCVPPCTPRKSAPVSSYVLHLATLSNPSNSVVHDSMTRNITITE